VRRNRARADIPAKVRHALLKDALAYAAGPRVSQYGVHGGAYDILAVRTTVAKTGSKTPYSGLPGSTHVFVVGMRAPVECKQPVGGTCPPAVLELEYLTSTLALVRDEKRHSYPDLKKFGIPVRIGGSKAMKMSRRRLRPPGP
jgi:hypothetical protein